MRSIVLAAGAVLVLLLVGLVLAREPLLDWAVERTILAVREDRSLLDDGELHLYLCGTGAPAMDPTANSACSAIVAGGEVLMIDAGAGGFQQLTVDRVPVSELSTILVTHFHSDHIGGLGDALSLSAFLGRERPVTIYGPPGIEQVVEGFWIAYAQDSEYRSHPEGGFVDPKWTVPEIETIWTDGDEAVTVLERGALRVTAFAVDHYPVQPAYGYRVDYHDRSVVFSGDTRRDERLVDHAAGADILVHSAMGLSWIARRGIPTLERLGMERDAKLMAEGQRIFATPVEVAGIAAEAGVGKLVFSHKPPLPRIGEPVYLWGVSDVFDGEVVVGRDGMRFDLSAR